MNATLRDEVNRVRKAVSLPPARVGYRAAEGVLERWFALAASHAGYAGLPGQPIYNPAYVSVRVAQSKYDRAREIKANWQERDTRRAEANARLLPRAVLWLQHAASRTDLAETHEALRRLEARSPVPEPDEGPPPECGVGCQFLDVGTSYPREMPLAYMLARIRADANLTSLFEWSSEEKELCDLWWDQIESEDDE